MKTRLLVALSGLFLAMAALAGAGCSALDRDSGRPPASSPSPSFPQASEGEFSVMSFNLHRYHLQEPGPESDSLDPRPPASAAALADVIRQVSPDILAVQEMGDPAAWTEFKHRLRQAGLEYRYEEYLRRSPRDLNLAVLSRFPIVGRTLHTNDLYTIGPTKFPVQRGYLELDIEINPAYRLRLMNAHLKSKAFHEYGQAEMRRNESRLLGNHVRAALDENPHVNLLVVGTLNDAPGSRSLREIHTYQDETLLWDLRPADSAGDAWTLRSPNDTHHRTDYMLAGSGLLNETVLDKTYAVRSPLLLNATDHRPLVATFVARERDPAAAPDLSTRQPPEFPNGN
jgi:endonuclease/exonuclease/phosphatase family metal-dependent hydrolase